MSVCLSVFVCPQTVTTLLSTMATLVIRIETDEVIFFQPVFCLIKADVFFFLFVTLNPINQCNVNTFDGLRAVLNQVPFFSEQFGQCVVMYHKDYNDN